MQKEKDMTLFGSKSLNKEEINVELTKEDCFAMVITRQCNDKKMECVDSSCIYIDEPLKIYKRLREEAVTYYHCITSTYAIVAATEKSVLFFGKYEPCYVHHYHCLMRDHTIVWGKDVYHNCSYEYVQTVNFITNNNMLVSNKENILFQLVHKFNDCDLEIFSTTSGLYLSKENKSLYLDKSSMDARTVNELILADVDYKSIESYKRLMYSQQLIYQKLCYNFLNTLKLLSNQKDFYTTLQSTNGEELTIQIKNGIAFIPQCNFVDSVIVQQYDNECYEKIPVEVKVDNKRTFVFVESNGILIQNSAKINDCNGYEYSVYLPNNKGLLKKIEKKIVWITNEQIHYQKIHIDTVNFSSLNFMHDQKIVQGTDILMQIKNLTNIMLLDNEFDAKNIDSTNFVSENTVIKTVNENLKSLSQSWYVIAHQILINCISFAMIVLILITIIICVKKRRRSKIVKKVSIHKAQNKEDDPIVEIEWDEMRNLMQSSRTSTNLKGRTCDSASASQ